MDRQRAAFNRMTSDPNWLPEGTGIEAIDALRAMHRAAINHYRTEAAPAREAHAKYEHEDRTFDYEVKRFNKGERDDAPQRTPADERATVLAPASNRAHMAREALLDAVEEIEGEFATHLAEWTEQAEAIKRHGVTRAADLRRQADEAERQVAGVDGLLVWMGRTARPTAFGHQPSSQFILTDLPVIAVPAGGIETIEVEV